MQTDTVSHRHSKEKQGPSHAQELASQSFAAAARQVNASSCETQPAPDMPGVGIPEVLASAAAASLVASLVFVRVVGKQRGLDVQQCPKRRIPERSAPS